jgi:hypothetical protein
MGRVLGFVGLLITVAIGAYIYSKQATSVSPAAAGNPRATIDLVGVQNDLLAIANAERRHQASDGKYVSLDELISNGDLSMSAKKRGPYEYSSDVSDSSFRVTATYRGETRAEGMPQSLSIDETMQVRRE